MSAKARSISSVQYFDLKQIYRLIRLLLKRDII